MMNSFKLVCISHANTDQHASNIVNRSLAILAWHAKTNLIVFTCEAIWACLPYFMSPIYIHIHLGLLGKPVQFLIIAII